VNLEQFSLRDRTAVVTGAAGLLGREHCLALGDAGARVVVTDLDAAACAAFAGELERRDIRAMAVAADITDARDIERLRGAVLDRFGSIDALINNAAIDDKFSAADDRLEGRECRRAISTPADLELSRFENYPLERWRRTIEVNVTGTFLCCQILGGEMARRGRGSIVNVASTYGVVAPDQSLYQAPDGAQRFFKSAAYPTSKGAVVALSRYLATYWAKAGVRVNTLSPGGVEAGQDVHFVESYGRRTPLGRMARADEYRGAVVFLASDASSYMTGFNLVVDGGWTAW
jgi:NAD(P)-dependent dehydrogenase (short-subunit alcohol dehydrogenase family)